MNKPLTRFFSLLTALLLMTALPALAGEAPVQEEAAQENFFARLKLTHLDGSPFDASVFNGTPVFLNIWATWCPPCVQEMPHLDRLAGEYADRIHIIGLHSEGLTFTQAGELVPNGEAIAAAAALRDELGLTYPLLNPDVSLFILMNSPSYGLQAEVLPTTWLIDGEGYIRRILPGSRDEAGWRVVIEEFLTKLLEEADGTGEG